MELQRKRYNDTNIDAIIQYYEAGGESNEEGITLTDKQVQLDIRWRFAAEKIREQKYKREQVARFICSEFKVSRDTAFRDIVCAERVHAASYPLNKKFTIQQRIEMLIGKINECYIDKDVFNAAQLEKILQKYLEKFPESSPLRTPAKIIFHVTNNNLLLTQTTPQQALEQADDIIKIIEERDDY